MSRAPKLRRIVAQPRIDGLIRKLVQALGLAWVELSDTKGCPVWGERPTDAEAAIDVPLEYDGQAIGTLCGAAGAAPLVDVLRYLIAEEANKKAMAGEVLDAYREITLLYKLSQRLTTATKRQHVLQVALEESNRLINASACLVLTVVAGGAEAQRAAVSGDGELNDALDQMGRMVLALGSGKGDIVNDLSGDGRFAAVPNMPFYAAMWAPLQAQERTLGLVVVGNTDARRHYTAADLSLLRTIASQAAPAFENATLYENLEELVFERTSELSHAKEEAEAANRAKNLFLASMSHELRTPLNAMLGYAQILKRDSRLSRKQFEGLDVIQRSGEHLLKLINDILDLSRIEAGRVELSIEAFDLSALLEDVQAMFRVRAEQRSLAFVCKVAGDVPAAVEGDAKCLRQVLTNLLSNAVKFTPAGEVRLIVRPVGDRLCFVVEDTGVGIAQAEQEMIFESFRQAGSVERKAQGTGLGLAICRQLVELMDGSISVQSRMDEGSTFTVALPLPAAVRFEDKLHRGTIVGYQGPRLKVLVADDDEASRSVLVHLLEPLGMEVRQARDGQEAVKLALETKPHLVLMDLVMPVVGGFEAIEQIRGNPQLEGTRIIALSASVGAHDRARSRTCGADDFVAKPVRTRSLFAAIGEQLGIEWVHAPARAMSDVQHVTQLKEAALVEALDRDAMHALMTFAEQGNISGILGLLSDAEVDSSPGRLAFQQEALRLTKSFALRPLRDFLAGFSATDDD